MNDLLLLVTAVLSTAFVVGGWWFGKERLYSVMIVFLILISAVGGKVVVFFGHATNTGNIFYASVYLATYFIIERFGRREGIYSIWVGVIAVLFFSLSVYIVTALVGSPDTAHLNSALSATFAPLSRLALASLCAYALSQTLNVHLYLLLREHFERKYLWLRVNIANFFAQIVDSIVFFTIAFVGSVSHARVWDILLTGFVIKVMYMMCASPLLYLNRVEEERDGLGNVAIVLHR